MDEFLTMLETTITRWHGVTAPNEVARRMAADLDAVIRGFTGLRGTLQFEDEPSSFETALQATKETAS